MKRKKVLLVLSLALMAAVLAGCAAKSAETEGKAPAGLTIQVAELTAEPTFVDWTQDGTEMQLIAVMDGEDSVRLALNTCQSCGGSPYAWFEYLGQDTLQCQNCGLTFPLESVGTERAAGCNPVTITDFTVEDGVVTVPESLLGEMAPRFANWKKIN